MGFERTGDWGTAYRCCDSRLIRDQFLRRMHFRNLDIAEYVARQCRRAIERGGYKNHKFIPLHTYTIERKGHGTPMFDTGKLKRAYQAKPVATCRAFVGVSSRAAVGKQDLAEMAATLEEGMWIKITPEMKEFLRKSGFYRHLKFSQPGKRNRKWGWIRIPPREVVKVWFTDVKFRRVLEQMIEKAAWEEAQVVFLGRSTNFIMNQRRGGRMAH